MLSLRGSIAALLLVGIRGIAVVVCVATLGSLVVVGLHAALAIMMGRRRGLGVLRRCALGVLVVVSKVTGVGMTEVARRSAMRLV